MFRYVSAVFCLVLRSRIKVVLAKSKQNTHNINKCDDITDYNFEVDLTLEIDSLSLKHTHTHSTFMLGFICNGGPSLGSIHNTDGDEENAAQEGSSQGSLDDLLQTRVPFAVSPEQGRDVEAQLCDGAERGVHNRAHSKVTLR